MDLVMHFDSKQGLFIKRPYKHKNFHGRIHVKRKELSEELYKLLCISNPKNKHYFPGGMFKLNDYGEVLRKKKLIGKVEVFPKFIDFIIDNTDDKIRCKECGKNRYLTVDFGDENCMLIAECRTTRCRNEGQFIEFFKTKYRDKGLLGGMEGFEYDHEVDESGLYKSLATEYNDFWRGIQK